MSLRRNMTVLWLATFATAVGMHAMVPFLTYFVEDLGVEGPGARNLWAGILVGAAPVSAALMGPLWGSLGDRHGRKPMVLRALASIALFVGLMGTVESVWSLLVLRIMQGLFSGYMPPALALVSAQAPEDRQGRVSGIMNAAFHAGAVVGLALGGVVAMHANVRAIFPICSVLAVTSFVAVLIAVKEDRSTIVRRRGEGLQVIASIRRLLASRRLVHLLACVIVVRVALSMIDPHFARYVELVGGTLEQAGYIFAAQALTLLCFMPLWGRFTDRRGPELTFVLCATVAGAGLAAQAFATGPGMLFALRLFNGAFLAGVVPAGYTMAARATARESRGSAVGVVFMIITLSHAVGAVIGGSVLNVLGFRGTFALDAVVITALALAMWRFAGVGRTALSSR